MRQWSQLSDIEAAALNPPSQVLTHSDFSGSRLYSIADGNTVVVTDIDTYTVTWFRADYLYESSQAFAWIEC